MRRDVLALAWCVVVAATFAGILSLVAHPTISAPALVLAPDPWSGAFVAFLTALVGMLPVGLWTRPGHRIRSTAFGLTWEPSGIRQRLRVMLSAATAYVSGFALWMALGPNTVVDMRPFLDGAAPDLVARCSTTWRVPEQAMWAVQGMCHWNEGRWVPAALGALVVGGLLVATWVLRGARADVMRVALDGSGLTVTSESGERRVPWSEVESVRWEADAVHVSLLDGPDVHVPTADMCESEILTVVHAIREHIRPPEHLTRAEKVRIKRVARLGE